MPRIVEFFVLTFALTWTTWVGGSAMAARSGRGVFALGGPLFLLGVFAPSLVALSLTMREQGRTGVSQLLARIGRWELDARWYVFAIGYFAMIKLSAAAVHRVAAGEWPVFGGTPWLLMLAAIPLSTFVQAGEEIGWRGFALPRLAERLGLGVASIVLGAIWAAWHLPLFFLAGTGSDGQSFPIYLLQVMALSVAMTWLYWKTGGSLLLVMLMHASVNNTTGLVPAAVPGATDPFALSGSLVAWITAASSWLIAIPLLFSMRGAGIGPLRTSTGGIARPVVVAQAGE
jgi:membrane protease YdiL (CAAX protease family)